jgi:murein DD-endopeptidase MepM/ murein hydrolase activator NlpD
LKFTKTFSNWLTNRYQLVIRNEENLAEQSTFSFNYAKLIALLSILFSILVVCSLLLANTLLAMWLNPAYIEQENKKKITLLSAAVEELETQNTQQKKFIDLLQDIIAGKEITDDALQAEEQASSINPLPPSPTEPLAVADSLLQSEFESNDSSLLNTYNKPSKDLQELFFFTPVNGIITTPFKHQIGHYGVDIVAKENEPIKCVADGVVIFAAWTVETGWVMVIQHNKDLTSIYKHNAALLKKVGNFVEGGEVIAIMGNSGELSTGPHLHFELWYEGNAVNPEHFIAF